MLKRRGVPTLAELARRDAGEDEKPRHKPFKDYEPGYLHLDIKHLPRMPGEDQKRYLYVAIDRATRWVYLEVRRSQSAKEDRKSTRLNSSHVAISYAVFCLKKKTTIRAI